MLNPSDRQLCDCNPPMIMASSQHCGHCGRLRRDCANPLERAMGQLAAVQAHMTEMGALPPDEPDVHEYPAMMTHMSPQQFKEWLNAAGTLYLVYLPGNKAFPIKVPDDHHSFFVAMLTQLRIHLGPEVQAQSAQPVTTPPTHSTPPAPGTLPPETALPIKIVDTSLRHSCPGSGQMCRHPRNREIAPSGAIRDPGRGPCPVCHGDYKLTNAGAVRLHRNHQPKGSSNGKA